MERPRPSSSAAPSIWYDAVAAPQRKSAGKPAGAGVRGKVTDLSSRGGRAGSAPSLVHRRAAVNALSGDGSVVLEQLVAEERRGVVTAQVEVAQVVELVTEGLVDLAAGVAQRGADVLEGTGGLLGQPGQPIGSEDEQRGQGEDD